MVREWRRAVNPHMAGGGPTSSAPELFEPLQFSSSPLYMALCPVVAGNDFLRRLALRARPGQRPEFAFFGAVHLLLLSGVAHELATFYPSVVGQPATSLRRVGQALESFCREHYDDLGEILSTRLVQTNHVRRAVGLRAGLAMIAPQVEQPIDLIEVGSSAGLLLGFDRYGYRLHRPKATLQDAPRVFGDAASPVQIDCDVLGDHPAPDLNGPPPISSVSGVDLNPIDPNDMASRKWLEALVWPEDNEQRRLLSAALDVAAQYPPTVLGGDAIDILPPLADDLASDHARVVFHCATRIHVPERMLCEFDEAIRKLGDTGPLWEIAIEYPPAPDPRPAGERLPGVGMTITDPAGASHLVAVVDGHLRWFRPLGPVRLGQHRQ